MRVCLVSYEFPPQIGGEASYTYGLATGLSALGHEVTVLVPAKRGVEYRLDRRFALLRVGTSRLPALKVAGFVIAVNATLPHLVRRLGVELVHFTFDYPSFPVRTKGLGAPAVATVHHLHAAEALGMIRAGRNFEVELPSTARSFFFSLMERVLVRRASLSIAVSRFTQRSLGSYLGVLAEKTRVVLNGVDAEELMRAKDGGRVRTLFRLGDAPFFLCVGRVEKSKGLEYLLDAFSVVERRAPSFRLVVVGGGNASYARRLRDMVADLGLQGSVTFTGRVSRRDLCELYAASTALVSPSLMEGFGMSLIEAMAAGKPCIASRVGAVPEVVQQGRTGILVPPARKGDLSSAMLSLALSPDKVAAMGERGRELAAREFTVERMTRETAAVYAECAGKGATPEVK